MTNTQVKLYKDSTKTKEANFTVESSTLSEGNTKLSLDLSIKETVQDGVFELTLKEGGRQ